jgi:hypothetical protein
MTIAYGPGWARQSEPDVAALKIGERDTRAVLQDYSDSALD